MLNCFYVVESQAEVFRTREEGTQPCQRCTSCLPVTVLDPDKSNGSFVDQSRGGEVKVAAL